MKTILITGASEGLGLEISKIFSENGWEVVGISRKRPSDCNTKYIEADLTKEDGLNKIKEGIKTKYGSFDAIVNCAGILNVKKFGEIDYKDTEQLLKLNVIAPMMLVSKLKELIIANGADILNVGSTVGFKAYESQSAYGSSKWALRGLNENLRLEFKSTNTRIISFNPGGFKSKLFEKATGVKADLDKFMEPKYLAQLIYTILTLPKNIEVSEIIINRK